MRKKEKFTGKHKDPLTGTPFNSPEDFLKIRENYFLDQEKGFSKTIKDMQAQQKRNL